MRTPAPVPELLLDVAQGQEGLVSALQCERYGVGTSRRSRAVRTGRWRAVTRGVYDTLAVPPEHRSPADVPRSPVPPLVIDTAPPGLVSWPPPSDDDRLFGHLRRRTAWVGLLAYGPETIAVGTSALALHGVEGLPAALRPQTALPAASRREGRPDIPLRQFDDGMSVVPFGDRRTGSRRIATAEWALAQAVPELPMANGLAVLDSALRLHGVDRRGFERSHEHARGRRGVAPRHELWDLADPRAASPLESFGRWQCIEEGVPPDVLQLPVHTSSGRLIGVGDMAWSLDGGRTLVAEMDGYAWHEGSAGRRRHDRDRDNAFAAVGVHLLRFDSRHVARHEVGVAVRSFLRRRTGG